MRQAPAVTKTAVWSAWKNIRKQLGRSSLRDVTDFVEYDIDPEVWIRRLLRELRQETYEPSRPIRFHIAKSGGFTRRMTQPSVPDLVLYRAIVDTIYRKAKPREAKHVYFERRDLGRAQQAATAATEPDEYGGTSQRRFEAWLRYNQYRKYLVFERIYPFLLVTDIANYFDSILYCHVSDSLLGLSVPPSLVGLLFFLLERLSYRDTYTESPRIGLPVDEFDCSRKLAHIVLFPHDQLVTQELGENAYVRWMDDQNVGVESRAQGLRAVSTIARSLGRLHLTPNTGKTKLLTLAEARKHFHLAANDDLDLLEKLPCDTGAARARLRASLLSAWRRALAAEGIGEWPKILKRVYRFAALARSRAFRTRSKRDLLRHPTLARRIADYVRATGSPTEYLNWADALWKDAEQPYGDVNLALMEGLLRVEPTAAVRPAVWRKAATLLDGSWRPVGWPECAAVAPLLLLRFGDRRSFPRLLTAIGGDRPMPDAALKACAVVFASCGPAQFRAVRRAAGRLLRNPLAEVVRFVERLESLTSVPVRFKARVDTKYDPVTREQFVDMRTVVVIRLLSVNRRPGVVRWQAERSEHLVQRASTEADKRIVKRLVRTS